MRDAWRACDGANRYGTCRRYMWTRSTKAATIRARCARIASSTSPKHPSTLLNARIQPSWRPSRAERLAEISLQPCCVSGRSPSEARIRPRHGCVSSRRLGRRAHPRRIARLVLTGDEARHAELRGEQLARLLGDEPQHLVHGIRSRPEASSASSRGVRGAAPAAGADRRASRATAARSRLAAAPQSGAILPVEARVSPAHPFLLAAPRDAAGLQSRQRASSSCRDGSSAPPSRSGRRWCTSVAGAPQRWQRCPSRSSTRWRSRRQGRRAAGGARRSGGSARRAGGGQRPRSCRALYRAERGRRFASGVLRPKSNATARARLSTSSRRSFGVADDRFASTGRGETRSSACVLLEEIDRHLGCLRPRQRARRGTFARTRVVLRRAVRGARNSRRPMCSVARRSLSRRRDRRRGVLPCVRPTLPMPTRRTRLRRAPSSCSSRRR